MIELPEDTRIPIIKGQAGCSADGQAAVGKFFQTVHIVVWYGIGLSLVEILRHFCAVISVEPIGRGYPEESVVILGEIVDVIAAKPFGDG